MARKSKVVDLPFLEPLDRSSGQLGRQLVHALREAVSKGELRPGDPLPSSRLLAASLEVSRGTIIEVYDQLLAEGVLESRRGAGTFVSRAIAQPSLGKQRKGRPITGSGPETLPPMVAPFSEIAREFTPLPHVPFAISVPVGMAAPDDVWRRVGNRIRARGPGAPAGYGDPQGVAALREAITDYVRRSRSVHCIPDQVVITNGIQQALFICCQLLLQDGDEAWVENPAYRGITAILETFARHTRTVRVPVDSEGIDVETGVTMARHARAAFVTPSHQYPLGVPMSMARRKALLSWAKENSAWIVEDDYDSELRYSGHPFPSLQGLDPERVLYLGTFSKVLFPSLRLGYAIVPQALASGFIGVRVLMDRHPPNAEQHVLAAFMSEGHLDRHIRKIRGVYAERQGQLVALLRRLISPELAHVQPSDQGMHLVLWLNQNLNDLRVAESALGAGIAVRAVSPLFARGTGRPGLVLGIGDFDSSIVEKAVKKLAVLLASGLAE